MNPVRLALIGVGMIGTEHAAVFASSPGADLVVAYDPDPAATTRLPEGVATAPDLASALDTAGIEAVVVCTPQATHRMVVEQALRRGLPVLCEKPLAHDLTHADAMIRMAAETGVMLAVGHTLRFDPDYLAVAQAVASGELGALVSIAVRRNVPDHEGRMIARRATLPVEVLVHDLDLLRWVGGDVERVFCEASRQGAIGDGLIDAVVATARLASGAVATLESNWVMASQRGPASDFRLSVVGTKGSASIEYGTGPVAIFGETPRFPVHGWLAEAYGARVGVLRTEDEHFLRCVRGLAEWPVSLADARAALAAALALDVSIKTGQPVDPRCRQ